MNENHEFVQELSNNCGYSLELSIRAVESTRGKSLLAALNYLQSCTDSENMSNQIFEQQFCRLVSDEYEDMEVHK